MQNTMKWDICQSGYACPYQGPSVQHGLCTTPSDTHSCMVTQCRRGSATEKPKLLVWLLLSLLQAHTASRPARMLYGLLCEA
jgi:hypothetical protein